MGFKENMRDITEPASGDPAEEIALRQAITASAQNLIAEYSGIYAEELRNNRYHFPIEDEHKQAHYELICRVVRFIPNKGGTTPRDIERSLENKFPNLCTATTCAVLLDTSKAMGLQTADVINTTSAQGLHDAIQSLGVPITDLRRGIPADFRVNSGDLFFEYNNNGRIKHSFIMHHVDYKEDGTVEMRRIDGGQQVPHESFRPFASVDDFHAYLREKDLVCVNSFELMKTLNPDRLNPTLDVSPTDLAEEQQRAAKPSLKS